MSLIKNYVSNPGDIVKTVCGRIVYNLKCFHGWTRINKLSTTFKKLDKEQGDTPKKSWRKEQLN